MRHVEFFFLGLRAELFQLLTGLYRWLGSRVVSVLDSDAEGPGSNRSRDAVG